MMRIQTIHSLEMIVRNNESNLVSLCDVKPKAELGLENYEARSYIKKFWKYNSK